MGNICNLPPQLHQSLIQFVLNVKNIYGISYFKIFIVKRLRSNKEQRCIVSQAESRVRGLCSAPTLTPTLTLTFMPTFTDLWRLPSTGCQWWVAVRPHTDCTVSQTARATQHSTELPCSTPTRQHAYSGRPRGRARINST